MLAKLTCKSIIILLDNRTGIEHAEKKTRMLQMDKLKHRRNYSNTIF